MAACSNSSANTDTIYYIITKLIEKGCILNVGDKYGQTPLMRAIGSGFVAVVRKFLEEKVNIEMRDQQGWTVSTEVDTNPVIHKNSNSLINLF